MRQYRIVGLGVALFAALFIALDFNKLYALRYGSDLGAFLQMAVNLRHGSSWNGAEWLPHFQVHNSWILSVLALPVALAPRAQTLLVIQVLVVASAAFALVRFALGVGLSERNAQLVGIAYLLAPATQGLAYDNFSENVFVPLVWFCGAVAVRARAWWPTLLFAQIALGLKEDQVLFIAWFGLACAIWHERRLGIALMALAAINGIAFVIIEGLAGGHPRIPSYTLAVHDVSGKISMTVLLLAPYAFAPLAAGWRFLLALPLFAEVVFAGPWAYEVSRIGSHWVAPLLAGISLLAVLGLARYPVWTRAVLPCALIAGLFFSDTVVHPGRWPYIVDWPAYAAAVRLRDSGAYAVIPREREGVWAVAAANPNVRLLYRPHYVLAVRCPGYDLDARAFFASVGIGKPVAVTLCGGVPVSPNGLALR